MAHFLEHLVFKGGEKYDDYRKVNETAERMGGVAQRLHLARPRRLPHHLPRRGRRRGDRPADRLRRAPEDRRRRARPRARRRHPGDRTRYNDQPSVGRRAPDRPRRVRRPPARAPRARPGGAPAHLHARRDRRLPRAPVGRRARRRVPRRQPRPPARGRRDRRAVRPLPVDLGQRRASSPRRRSRRRRWSRSATPTSRTCGCPTGPTIDAARPAERAALTIYSTLLGGSMGSRLFDEIREQRGLCYSRLRGRPRLRRRADPAALAPGLDSTKCVEAYTRMREIVDELRADGPTEEEVERAPRLRRRPPRAGVREHERRRPPRRHPDHRLRRGHRPRRGDRRARRGRPSTRSPRSPAGSPRSSRSPASGPHTADEFA